MAGFSEVLGHEQTILHMKHAIEMDKVSHAYIISGEKGSGKKLLADLFARTLQCEKKGTEACMECQSCKQAVNRNQPDIIRVTHEKPNTISVEDIRTQVNGDIMIRPYSSLYKIYIVDEAEKLSVQAQNALLKTIEEPPEYAVFLLLTANVDALLPTICSRCVRLDVRPVSDALVKRYLVEQMHVPEQEAAVQATFAQGNIGKARQSADSDGFGDTMRKALYLLKQASKMEVHEWIEILGKMSQEQGNIYDYLDIFQVWFRDVLMFKATREIGRAHV